MAEIAGMKLIVPTSVSGSGVSVSASGKVTFTNTSSISINGCFTSTYSNYVIICRFYNTGGSGSGQYVFARWRAAGSDNSTAGSYTYQEFFATGGGASAARNSSDRTFFADSLNTLAGDFHRIYVYGPNLAQRTAFRKVAVRATPTIWDVAGTHNQTVAYDGLTMYTTSFNVDGFALIYGLSQ